MCRAGGAAEVVRKGESKWKQQPQHAVVAVWMSSEKVHDNGKAPAIPQGWYPAEAQIA